MRPRRDPVPRARDAWVWLGGTALLGILGAGVIAAAVLLWENVDIRQLTPGLVQGEASMPVPEPPAPPAIDRVGFSAVLFNSPRNRAYFPEAGYYDVELGRWRELLTDVGGVVREVADFEQLRGVRPDEVLVLSETPCLSPAELAAVRGHISRAGSVVSNWATGVRDADCAWRGWATLLELTGAEEVQELRPRQGLFITVPAGLPLSVGLHPGTRIELRPDPSLALRMAGPRVYWSDWALNPEPDAGGFGTDVAASATRTSDGGRNAWFGWRLGQAASPADSVRVRRLVQNGVLWAAGRRTATIAAWPGGATAALVFILDVEDRPRAAMDVAALFGRERLPATFYAVTSLVAGDAELAQALIGIWEVGSQTVDHTRLAGLTRQDQTFRLRRSWNDVEAWTGVGPAGLRPPEDAFDSVTLSAWRQVGGEYVLARTEARSASPEIHRVLDGDVIVVLPRLLKDDYNVIVQDRAVRAERITEAFLEGARKLHAIGGLAVVAGHTQIMAGERRLEAYRVVADTARAQGDWWIARADRVARWWRARAASSVTFDLPRAMAVPSGLRASGLRDLLVRGAPDDALEDAWIDLVLPAGSEDMIPLVDGHSVEFARTDWGVRIPVGTLLPGEERRIALVFVEGTASAPLPRASATGS